MQLTSAMAVVLFLIVAGFFISQVKSGRDSRKDIDTEIEGVNLTYLTFNKNNEKKLEIKCLESQKKDDDTLLMKNVTATIFNADKLDQDIHVSADSGHAKNDFNDFYLQGNVRITSPSFTLSSRSFDLKGLNLLSTKDPAAFTLRDMSGQAQNGLLYFINNKYIKMFDPSGVLVRAGKSYNFKSRVLRVVEKKKTLFFDKDATMDGEGTTLRGDRLSLQFDQSFVNLEWAAANGHCYFQTVDIDKEGQRQSREITANQIKMWNDPQGRLQKIEINGDGKISLVGSSNQGQIQSDNMEISLRSETQMLETVRALTRGTVTNSGKDNLTVSGDMFLATFSQDAVLSEIQAEKNCFFLTDDFSGETDELRYDAPHFKIDLSGKDSIINSRRNVFHSSRFLIQTKLKQLSSDSGVKATLVPGKKSVLLGAKPVFVTAAAMETSDKGDSSRFSGKVNLFQDEVELHSEELLFNSSGARIACRGGADLKFSNDGEQVALRGKTIAFDPDGGKIVIEGEARLQQGPNALAARSIELAFGPDDKLENIFASDQVLFNKGNIEGRAQLLHWQYARKIVLFRDAAEITRKGAGTTRGKELRFDLESNKITVSGSGDRSETTLREERP